ncbi:MAG: hypothetical protein IJ806_05910 [Ruminococcus sp.]|nr:hypothetical protein [Ruminococcus sp.]
MNKYLNEELIGDILLCDPVTRRGKECLKRIGLTVDDINLDFFYDNICVQSQFDSSRSYEPIKSNIISNPKTLYYQYTVDFEEYKYAKEQLVSFNERFISDVPNEFPLLMIGVAGNGKSIEINRKIRISIDQGISHKYQNIYIDLEDSKTKITYGNDYYCPQKNPLWLFCAKLLESIMEHIKECHFICSNIATNFTNTIEKNNSANRTIVSLFNYIGQYTLGNNTIETKIFNTLIEMLDSNNVEKNIHTLLEIMMYILYCTDIECKHYIVIDNIEQYIKLNKAKIQIPDSDISKIYECIDTVISNVVGHFDRIEHDLAWKSFKIILVIRRTSVGMLIPSMVHSTIKYNQNISDITGHFLLTDIWKNKKRYIWENKLKYIYTNPKSTELIRMVDLVMNDNNNNIGINYQSIIAPLMSYGIRRNARSQAHSIYSTYEMLSNDDNTTINLEEFKILMGSNSYSNNSIRYMFRRALLEFQFKWPLERGNCERWMGLNIGYLTRNKVVTYHGRQITVEEISYLRANCISLMRRILTFLSYSFDSKNMKGINRKKSIINMFETCSLYELIKGVLVNPTGKDRITDDDYYNLAEVLLSLSDMSNSDTRSAPYIIMYINNSVFHNSPNASTFSTILKRIWEAGEKESRDQKPYDRSNYGVRINDAGYSFLLNWQASFSFIASLYCYTIPPLFFLKDTLIIEYLIQNVYESSLKLCRMYENEAELFCEHDEDITIKTDRYLVKINGKYVTYKQCIKELHTKHLDLYLKYIQNNYKTLGFSEKKMNYLTETYIPMYIDKYRKWDTEGDVECF